MASDPDALALVQSLAEVTANAPRPDLDNMIAEWRETVKQVNEDMTFGVREIGAFLDVKKMPGRPTNYALGKYIATHAARLRIVHIGSYGNRQVYEIALD